MNLESSVTEIRGISEKSLTALSKLEIKTIRDLITYFPVRYTDTSTVTSIKDLILDEGKEDLYLIKAVLTEFNSAFIRGGRSIQRGIIDDGTGSIQVGWFNQNFLKNALKTENEYLFYGKLNKKGNRYMFFPRSFEKVNDNAKNIHLGRIVPEYKLTSGITKKVFRRWMNNAMESLDFIEIEDELGTLNKSDISLKKSLSIIHFPEDYEILDSALINLSMYELVNIHLKLFAKRELSKGVKPPQVNPSFNVGNIFTLLKDLISFELTKDQEEIILNLLNKIKEGELINEIIQGDVGTGKTIVAIAAALAMSVSGYQTVIMAPTTILAKQHYNNFTNILEKLRISVELVSSETKNNLPSQILIGTSAILARKSELISNLGMIIVDEQHKFGVEQREDLLKSFKSMSKNKYPHFINMTATPIPRSISQIIFGDVELETIKTKPKGRLPIKTLLVPEKKREDSYEWIREALKKGEQVYWVCPLIVESETLQVKSAKSTYQELSEYFSDFKVGLLHGRLKEKEKLQLMTDFSNNEINLLVSTSVIEVGIDVANANTIVIENAERFGLAQLHQIRGRVGRGDKQSWCLLFYSNNISENSLNRLKFLTSNNNGMDIAEFDLLNRGPGEIYGTTQSGVPDLKIAKLENLEVLNKAKKLAEKLWDNKIKKINLFN
ncbi:MAG: ATP-dependent DNA helicase RecG [Ignavibacteriaceae bacterium]|nr:ATP-dependent DNA helicase RecG [Ignavibacteriaceae bacterium]